MTPARLISCYFGADGHFARLARVLAHTAATQCPTWDRRIEAIAPRPMKSALGVTSHVVNTQKMEHWHDAVAAAPDDARMLLIDADTMILRPLDDIWDRAFDFAYTTKETRFPFNSGVVFLRVTPAVREFMRIWRDENVRMLGDARHHTVWRRKYGGINQASLGHALETGRTTALRILSLPCLEWNCEDSHWAKFDPEQTRIVHCKSGLRQAILGMGPATFRRQPDIARLARIWSTFEQDALAAAHGPTR
ncbi:MAG: hypothetical protein AB7O28_17160 [Vicinamibacterales bacterium]